MIDAGATLTSLLPSAAEVERTLGLLEGAASPQTAVRGVSAREPSSVAADSPVSEREGGVDGISNSSRNFVDDVPADEASAATDGGIDLSDCTLDGVLWKRSPAFHRAWQRRFFTLKSHYLFYSKKRGGELIGLLRLEADTFINLDQKNPLAFNLISKGKVLTLKAGTKQDMEKVKKYV